MWAIILLFAFIAGVYFSLFFMILMLIAYWRGSQGKYNREDEEESKEEEEETSEVEGKENSVICDEEDES